jgi:hypothetical protein
MKRRLSFVLLWGFALAQFLLANAIAIELNPAQPVVGESVQLIASIKGNAQNMSFHQVPQSEGLSIDWKSPSQNRSTSIVNGRMSQSLTLTWSGKAGPKGNYRLSPLSLLINGKVVQSNPISFKVGGRQNSRFYLLKAKTTRLEGIVGEPIELQIDLLFAQQKLRNYEKSLGRNYEIAGRHYDALSLPEPLNEDFHIAVSQGREERNGKGWYGQDIGSLELDGFRYRVQRLSFSLEPKKEGRLTIPAVDVPIYELGFQRDFFGRANAVRQGRPLMASSKPITLNISAPPRAGRPKSFNGQVCQFLNIQCEADDIEAGQEVQLHAPLSITVTLESDRDGSTLSAPNWKRLGQGWSEFDLNTSAVVRKDEGKRASFTGIIARPTSDAIKAIPAIEMSFFNTKSRAYEQASSSPFPIVVESISDEQMLEQQAQEVLALQPKKSEPKMSRQLHGLETDPTALEARPRSGLPAWLVFGFCLGSWLCYAWAASKDSRQQQRQRKMSSEKYGSKRSKQIFKQAQQVSEVLEQLNRYLQARFNTTDPSNLALPGETGKLLKTTLSELEASAYSPSGGALDAAKAKALTLLDQIEKAP